MADVNKVLESLISPYKSPVQLLTIPDIVTGTDKITIKAGKNNDEQQTPNIWVPLHLSIHLVCDATVVDRYVKIRLMSPDGQNDYDYVRSVAVTASQDVYISLVRIAVVDNMDVQAKTPGTDYWAGLLDGAFEFAGDEYIQAEIDSGVAGDAWVIQGRFRSLNRIYGILPKGIK